MQSSSTFDLNNTVLPGYNWYLQNYFEGSSFTATITGGVMTVTAVNAGNYGLGIIAGISQLNCGNGATVGTCPINNTTGNVFITNCPTTCTVASPKLPMTTGTYTISNSSISVPSSTQFMLTTAEKSADISFDANGVIISNVTQTAHNYSIGTYALTDINTSAPAPYHGISFKNGFYARAYYSFDQRLAVATGAGVQRWPAWWHQSYPGAKSGAIAVEIDSQDMRQLSSSCASTTAHCFQYGTHLHDYGSAGGNVDFDPNNFDTPFTSCPSLPNWDGTTSNFHALDTLWVPTTQGAGAGIGANTGIYVSIYDPDNCAGSMSVFTGSMDAVGNLTVTSVLKGTVTAKQVLICAGCNGNAQISSGSGTSWVTNQTGGAFSNQTIVGTFMSGCAYTISSNSKCVSGGTNYAGVFSSSESYNGLSLLISSGCSQNWSTTNCNVGTTAGNWPLRVKNVQVWGLNLASKVVQ